MSVSLRYGRFCARTVAAHYTVLNRREAHLDAAAQYTWYDPFTVGPGGSSADGGFGDTWQSLCLENR